MSSDVVGGEGDVAKGNGTATAVKLQPLGDRVVVQPAEREETTKSGIVLPDTAKEKPQRGTVIAVGKGRRDDDGDRIPMDVRSATRSCSPSTPAPSSSSRTRSI